jgi:penicillin-binding protein 1C
VALVELLAWALPRRPLLDGIPGSVALFDAHHRLLRLTLAADGQHRLVVPLRELSPLVVEATLLYEDRYFWLHPGVNPVALGRAVRALVGGGRRLGASTITMQLARRLDHLDTRTPSGKLRQLARALLLELRYSKQELLEAYLNLAPYGGNLEGVGAASLVLFGKRPSELTLSEALTLAVIPQNPQRRGTLAAPEPSLADTAEPPQHREQRPEASPELRAARARLEERWRRQHPETVASEEAARALDMPPTLRAPGAVPFLAPHFVDTLLARGLVDGHERRVSASGPVVARPGELPTTLELPLQRLVERHARAFVASQARLGVDNAAVLVVELRSMAVVAELGSIDWANASISGQVSGTTARRSPGSTLKPFVYALALDQGVIHPDTMLKDAPAEFGAWSPENFDGRYSGPLPAKEALIRSRNVPAVTLAGRLNRPSLYDWLVHAGVSGLADEAHYGLGLALGGAEVTMEELVTLYAALGAGGRLRPLRRLARTPVRAPLEGAPVLSAESSFLVLDMLKDNPRPDGVHPAESERARIAWKTGTSWGFRDAWSVGLVGDYVVAVWVGRFDGRGNPAFVGVQAAAPLFFRIADALAVLDSEAAREPRWAAPPGQVRKVATCATSGGLPTSHCPRTRSTWFIPGRSPTEPCTVHRQLLVDDASGRGACSASVAAGRPAHEELFEVWPSDLARLFVQAGLPRRPLPQPLPACVDSPATSARADAAPRISSPLRGVTYTLRSGVEQEQLGLVAVTDGATRQLDWFVDREPVGRSAPGVPLFVPLRPGRFLVRVVDEEGRSDVRELRVERAL